MAEGLMAGNILCLVKWQVTFFVHNNMYPPIFQLLFTVLTFQFEIPLLIDFPAFRMMIKGSDSSLLPHATNTGPSFCLPTVFIAHFQGKSVFTIYIANCTYH